MLVLGSIDQITADVLQGAHVARGKRDANAVHRSGVRPLRLLKILGNCSLSEAKTIMHADGEGRMNNFLK